MEWPKLKNIIILILLLVNGFLLVLVVGREFQVSRYERSAFTQAGQVLAQNGITVDEDLLEQAVRESLGAAYRPAGSPGRDGHRPGPVRRPGRPN